MSWISGKCPACGAEVTLTAHPAINLIGVHSVRADTCPVTEQLLDPES